MIEYVLEILKFYPPATILFIEYIIFRKHLKIKYIIFISWLLLCATTFIIGYKQWESGFEITKLGQGLLFMSAIFFQGPFILFANKYKNNHTFNIVWFALYFIVPYISVFIVFFVLAFFGQIWGM